MILADRRYNNKSKRSKLPPWIQEFLREENTNLSTDEAVTKMRAILRDIAQPVDEKRIAGDKGQKVNKLMDENDIAAWGAEKQKTDLEKMQNEARASWD